MTVKVSYITLTQGPDIWYIYVSGALPEHIKDPEFDSVASGIMHGWEEFWPVTGDRNEGTELLLCADQVFDNLIALQFLISSHLRELVIHGLSYLS